MYLLSNEDSLDVYERKGRDREASTPAPEEVCDVM